MARDARKAIATLAVAAALVAGLAFAWLRLAPRHVPAGQPPLTTLRSNSLPDFRAAFNASEGEARVVAMFSPT